MLSIITFVHACGRRAVLIMCTPMSSGSLESLFESDEPRSKSISAVNLKRNFAQLGAKGLNLQTSIRVFFVVKIANRFCLLCANLGEKMVDFSPIVLFRNRETYE